MKKIFNVLSNDQRGGTTAGEINEYRKQKNADFWNKPINKYFLIPLIVGFILVLISYFLIRPSMADNIFTVTSNNQQGGFTVGQLNLGVPPRHLTDEIKKQLESFAKKKIKILVINGSDEAYQYAKEIKTFLELKGREVDPKFGSYMIPAFGLDKRENADYITLIVGSAS